MDKEYYRKKSREHYLKHKAAYLERNRVQREAGRLLIEKLKSVGCSRCPEKDVRCMDFHHLDGEDKDAGLAGMIHFSEERILAEAAKCIILCANCHRKEHITER